MRKLLISFLLFAMILTLPSASQVSHSQVMAGIHDVPLSFARTLSEAGSSGSDLNTLQCMSRALTGYQLRILNSYADLIHRGLIDLSGYQVSGWTLYAVDIDATTITATAERKSLNVIKNTEIKIENDTAGSSLTTDALYQAFYNLPHDGRLENYSLTYNSPYYQPSQLGYAYLVVRSDYSSLSANITSWISPFTQTLSDTKVTHDVSADTAILDAGTYYYVVIDGTAMNGLFAGSWYYNKIFWRAQIASGLQTGYHLWDDNSWYLYQGVGQREAELNYTYTPWNKTSNAPIQYPSAESISLTNTTHPLTGTSWSFTSDTNITQIQFRSNQSVNIDYDITLWYRKTGTATTNWFVNTPGTNAEWNASTIVSYPVLTGTLERFLNYSIQKDWSPSVLYNGSIIVGGTYTKYGTTVYCTSMTDGTWILSSTAPNYVRSIDLTGVVDGKVSILTDMGIDATIEDDDLTPITGGDTNLTVIQAGSSIYSPPQIPASFGSASFTWDIDSTTLGNSTHSVEIWWTNGTEAGYLVEEVFVYYPTTLVADDITIDAYAENSFNIGVNFDQDFPIRGLDGTLADVEYSFDGGANTSLIDQTGGRWTAAISTAGKTDGTYLLYVYAEGYALENQSLTIIVNLIYETLSLNWSWSNTDNITYTNSTILSISYLMQDGITRISGATVNVTIEGVPHDMIWDSPTETYWVELTGGNFSGVGTFTLNVSASKAGYEGQNRAINITIRSETTGLYFHVDYSPDNLTISFIETLFIQVTYNFNSVPIDSNTVVRVLFNGSSPVALIYNEGSLKWETTLRGSNYLGVWNIIVRATSDGYATHENTTVFIVYEDTPIVSNSWIDSAATTDYVTAMPLSITLTMSNGTPINDANVSFTAFSSYHELLGGVAGVYTFNINPNETRGIESFTVTVVRMGYLTSQMTLELTVEATTSLTFSHSTYSEYEEWDITITVSYMDTHYNQPITEASVNISLGGRLYSLQYNNVSEVYSVTITLDIAPGSYTINAYASAEYAAYADDTSSLSVIAKDTLYVTITFAPPRVVAGQFMEVRATVMSNISGTMEPVQGEPIYFAITITYANGTILHFEEATMFDTTNTEGVATFGFDVPQGQIDSLTAKATFLGSRDKWRAETTETTGVEVSIFALVFSFLTSEIGLMIIFSMALLGIVAAGYNRGVKPRKRAARLNLQNQLQMFKDLETVRHFMAVYLDRGTCVFYHPFTEERIQPDLISGFIAAITSVYGEIKGDGVRGTLEEIQYHGLRLNSYSGEYIIGILILEGEMTPLLRERLQFFVELFENQYDQDLDGWTGLVDCFDPEWVVSTLNSAFNYAWHLPHRFGPTQKVKKTDARILDYISAARDDKNEFFIRNLLTPLAEMLEKTEAEVLDRLLYLQDRGIIVPIGIQTILQRQGLALVNGSEKPLQKPPAAKKKEVIREAPVPKEAIPEPVEELEFEEPVEEPVEEKVVEPEPEVDEMEAFVQDVESLLVKQSKEKKKKDDELEKFTKELREKIGEDEDAKE